MVQSLQLGTSSQADEQNGMRRLNRLPIIIAIIVVVVFIGVVVIGLSLRGLSFNRGNFDDASNSPATSFGDQLKRGISDGIIGEPDKQEVFQPAPVEMEKSEKQQPIVERQSVEREESGQSLEPEEVWKARLKREQDEQYMREAQRQRMARIQAGATALDSPLKVDVSDIDSTVIPKVTLANSQPPALRTGHPIYMLRHCNLA